MRLAKRRKVRPDDPVAVVTRFLDAANHHDADGLRGCVHPEFESFHPLHPARNFRGAGQLISNWKAIFEAEPGFRLTLLRASTTGNTVWAEIHGAGASAEAAGIFIVGVEDGRIRWIRVYSDLVEPLPEQPVEEAPAPSTPAVDWDRDPIRLVPPRDAGEGEAAEEEGEGEGEEEPAEGDEPEVAAATAPGPADVAAPALRLVGAGAVEEEPGAETAAEDEASPAGTPDVAAGSDVAEVPDGARTADAAGVAAADGDESIEVLGGDAPEVAADPTEPAGPDPEADAKEAVAEADEAEIAATESDDAPAVEPAASEDGPEAPAASEDDDGPGSAWWDTVAGLGGARPDAAGSEGQPARRRLGFLRRGGRGGGS